MLHLRQPANQPRQYGQVTSNWSNGSTQTNSPHPHSFKVTTSPHFGKPMYPQFKLPPSNHKQQLCIQSKKAWLFCKISGKRNEYPDTESDRLIDSMFIKSEQISRQLLTLLLFGKTFLSGISRIDETGGRTNIYWYRDMVIVLGKRKCFALSSVSARGRFECGYWINVWSKCCKIAWVGFAF